MDAAEPAISSLLLFQVLFFPVDAYIIHNAIQNAELTRQDIWDIVQIKGVPQWFSIALSLSSGT